MKVIVLSILLSFQAHSIVGGIEANNEPLIVKSTVALTKLKKDKLSSFCTGTVIQKNLILTADHCLAGFQAPKMFVSWGEEISEDRTVEVDSFKYYHTRYYEESLVYPARDIALLMLKNDLPLLPAKIGYPANIKASSSLLQAGYGNSNPQPYGVSAHGKLFMLNTSVVNKFENNFMELIESKGQGTRNGDSGGPLFLKVDLLPSILEVHGILNGGGLNYSFYNHPYYYITWINCSLPENLRFNDHLTLEDQVKCDQIPFQIISTLTEFNKIQCETQKPGFSMFEDRGCWPATEEACLKHQETFRYPKIIWDEVNKSCQAEVI